MKQSISGFVTSAVIIVMALGSTKANAQSPTQFRLYDNSTLAWNACEAAAPDGVTCQGGSGNQYYYYPGSDTGFFHVCSGFGIPPYMDGVENGASSGLENLPDCVDCREDNHCGPDGSECTTTGCGGGECYSVLDESLCTCNAEPPVSVPLVFTAKVSTPEIQCAVVGGNFNISVEQNVSIEKTYGDCSNGCVAQHATGGKTILTANLCKASTMLTVTPHITRDERSCINPCTPQFCQNTCETASCDTGTNGAVVQLGVSKGYGIRRAGRVGLVSYNLHCGANLGAAVGAGYSTSYTVDQGVGDCMHCVEGRRDTASLTLEAKVTGGCAMGLNTSFSKKTEFGCSGCVNGGVNSTLIRLYENIDQTGLDCYELKSSGAVAMKTPKYGAPKIGWWSPPSVQCQASMEGCSSYNSCGSPSCDDESSYSADTDVMCVVKSGVEL